MKKMRSAESGSVLWFIIIAVGLIAALTAVLSRSSSTVDQTGDVEQLRIAAGQILRTAKAYETVVQDMRLRGVPERNISFQTTALGATYNNARCPAANSDCRVFDVGGGGITYTAPAINATTTGTENWMFTASAQVETLGTVAADLLVVISNMREDLCRQINRLSGVNAGATPPFAPPVNAAVTLAAFTGTYAASPALLEGASANNELAGQSTGCFRNGAAGAFIFYSVILER